MTPDQRSTSGKLHSVEQEVDLGRVRRASARAVSRLELQQPPSHLPLLDAPSTLPGVETIVRRVAVLSAVSAVAYGLSRQPTVEWIVAEGLIEVLAPSERDFLLNERAVGDEQRRPESLFALAWAVSLIPGSLDFRSTCPESLVSLVPRPPASKGPAIGVGDVVPRCRLQPMDAIVRALDLAYCIHWAMVDAELRGEEPQLPLPLWIIVERRRSLEWLAYSEPWDTIDLST